MQKANASSTPEDIKTTGESEWRSGWKVVLAATAGCASGVIYTGAILTMTMPIAQMYGWSRAAASTPLLLCAFVMLLTAPVVGGSIDRFGPRRVALVGMPVYAVLLAAVGLSGPQIWTWHLAWILAACGASLTWPVLWTVGVAEHFTRNQGTAVGLTLCGTGISTTIGVPTAYLVYQHLGWKAVFPVLSFGSFLVAYPLVWLFFHDASSRRTRPARKSLERSVGDELPGMNFPSAVRTLRFWRLALSVFLTGLAMNGLAAHFIPMLTGNGVPAVAAAFLLAMFGPCKIAGRLVTGFLFDRADPRLVSMVAVALPIASCVALFQHSVAYAVLVPATILIGLLVAAEQQVIACLVPKYFGYRNYGRIFGFMFGLLVWGQGIGPVLAGAVFDYTGSYDVMLILQIAALATSSILIGTLGRYSRWT